MKRARYFALLTTFACSAAACSSNSVSATDTGSQDAIADGTIADMGTDTGPLAQLGGSININQTNVTSGATPVTNESEDATFHDLTTLADSGAACSSRFDGVCDITHCSASSNADAGAVPNVNVSAGTITIAGGTGAAIVLLPGATQAYGGHTANAARWNGGDMLSVNASGDTIPTFTSMITFPSRPVFTSPAMPAFPAAFMIDRTVPVTGQWTASGGSAGQVAIQINQVTNDGHGITSLTAIACHFDNAAGTGTVPVTALAELQVVAGLGSSSTTAIAMGGQATQTVQAGTYTIKVNAYANSFYALADVH